MPQNQTQSPRLPIKVQHKGAHLKELQMEVMAQMDIARWCDPTSLDTVKMKE